MGLFACFGNKEEDEIKEIKKRRSKTRSNSIISGLEDFNKNEFSRDLHRLIKGEQYESMLEEFMAGKRETLVKMSPAELREQAKELLQAGADVGHHIDGDSALHSAIYKEDIELVDMLLTHCNCAGIDEKNARGLTPFSLAMSIENWELACFLIDRGADPGTCFLTMCMSVGEIEGLNDERLKMLISHFEKMEMDKATIKAKTAQIGNQQKTYIRANCEPLFQYIIANR
jgi:hypothetical protein